MTQQYQYKWQSITEEINLEEAVFEEMGNRYTAALVQSLQNTRNSLLRKLLDDAPLFANNHEIEVNFDGKE